VSYWYLVIGVPLISVLLYQIGYMRSHSFRRWNHGMFVRMWGIGGLVRTSQISRFSMTFGTLVSSGVPHLRAFEIVRGALTNEHYREAVDEIRDAVREGEPIATAMEGTEMFDDVVVSMVEVGEESGELDRMCLRVGESYEDNFNRSIDVALKLIEPTMLLFMAVGVGGIAMAMFLPLFELLEGLGNAG
jgi:type IV pilus assembly protein PilC